MTIAATLNAAADLLESGGWCQGESETIEGKHCAGGAIEVNEDPGTFGQPAYEFFRKHLNDKYSYQFDSIPDWNDRSGREVEEIIAELREAATKAAG